MGDKNLCDQEWVARLKAVMGEEFSRGQEQVSSCGRTAAAEQLRQNT
jgi:hypothetical protein